MTVSILIYTATNTSSLRLNSHVAVTPHCVMLGSSNALEILTQYDIIVDATDNVATRFREHSVVYTTSCMVECCGVLVSFLSGTF